MRAKEAALHPTHPAVDIIADVKVPVRLEQRAESEIQDSLRAVPAAFIMYSEYVALRECNQPWEIKPCIYILVMIPSILVI